MRLNWEEHSHGQRYLLLFGSIYISEQAPAHIQTVGMNFSPAENPVELSRGEAEYLAAVLLTLVEPELAAGVEMLEDGLASGWSNPDALARKRARLAALRAYLRELGDDGVL